MQMDFMSCMSLAECAARPFAEWHTLKHPKPDSSKLRQVMRRDAVAALRFLWKNGDASQRVTVFARVAVWVGKNPNEMYKRILERENQRLERKEKAA